MNLGKALKETRLKSDFNQKDAAIKANISQSYLSCIESGAKTPSVEVIEKLCDIYKMPLAIVMFRAIEKKDVPQNKREAFHLLSPAINDLIDRMF